MHKLLKLGKKIEVLSMPSLRSIGIGSININFTATNLLTRQTYVSKCRFKKKNLLFIFKFKNIANLEKEEEEATNST